MSETTSKKSSTSVTDTRNVDVAIIGAGTAGMAAYRAALRRGANVLLIEGGSYGTTCARVGCMPSKLLIAAAEAAHHAREASPFGVNATVVVDGHAVMNRVRRERDRFVGFVLESIASFDPEHMVHGYARFASPNELLVDLAEEHNKTLHSHSFAQATYSPPPALRVNAKAVVIATGSSPFVPPMFDRIRDRLVVNDDVFGWETLPESTAIFGAGVIGLELGQALHRLGVRVQIFGRSGTVGPIGDPLVKEAAGAVFKTELNVDFDAKVTAIEPAADGADGSKRGVVVHYTDAHGNELAKHFATALIAAGRKPNVTKLALENAGINGIASVDRSTMRWGETSIFIAGDVNDDIPLLHEAADEGSIAGDNAARYPEPCHGYRRTGLAIAFTDPPLAVVAGGFKAVSERTEPYVIGEIDFKNQGRSRIMLKNHGAARVYVDVKTRRFLGAELAGPRAEHLAHLLAWAHQAELTIDQMLAMPFYHPVVEEGLRTALRDACTKLSKS